MNLSVAKTKHFPSSCPTFFHGEAALAGWKKVVDAVHAKGGKIAPQLWHVGAVRKEGTEPDKSIPGYSPSGLFKPGKENGVAMSKQDIDEVVEAFAQAAANSCSVACSTIPFVSLTAVTAFS